MPAGQALGGGGAAVAGAGDIDAICTVVVPTGFSDATALVHAGETAMATRAMAHVRAADCIGTVGDTATRPRRQCRPGRPLLCNAFSLRETSGRFRAPSRRRCGLPHKR